MDVNRKHVKVKEIRLMSAKSPRKVCLTKTSGVIVLEKLGRKTFTSVDQALISSKTDNLSVNTFERTYIRVTYRFLEREIFGLRRGVTVFTGS